MAVNRYYSSTAAKTSLNGGITNSATSITVNALTGYPVSTPWTAIIDRDLATEEVVTVTNVSSLTLTVTRGVDGTSGVAHSSGATFEHGVSARDFTEPQAHIAASSGVHGATGSVVGTSDAQTLTNKTLTSPTINGATVDAASTIGGVSGTTLADHETAWATYTPAWVAGTTPTLSTATGRYKQVGKRVNAEARVVASSTATAGVWTVTLPVTAASTNSCVGIAVHGHSATSTFYTFAVVQRDTTHISFYWGDGTSTQQVGIAGSGFGAVASGDSLDITITYEAA